MAGIREFILSQPAWLWISIVSALGCTVMSVVRMSHAHSERIEMIRHGLDPRPRRR
ncbi:MAG: hypothetical protein V3T70_07565 [Phycisphaerae bacterium]